MRSVITRLGSMFKPTDPAEIKRQEQADRGWLSKMTRLGPMFTDPDFGKEPAKAAEPKSKSSQSQTALKV